MSDTTSREPDSYYEVVRSSFRLSAKYNFIIYPLDYSILKKILEKRGFQVVKPPIPGMINVGTLEVEGSVGSKEDVTFDSLPDRQVIAVNSSNLMKSLSEFQELENDISNELSLRLGDNARFYETVSDLAVKTKSNPIRVFSTLRNNYPFIDELSKIFCGEVSPFAYRISPNNIPINSENWFEFTAEPLANRSTTVYHIGLVYRNRDRTNVMDFLERLGSTVTEALKILESESNQISKR
jgi:hypothetical protein